jgi:hypothetical protein
MLDFFVGVVMVDYHQLFLADCFGFLGYFGFLQLFLLLHHNLFDKYKINEKRYWFFYYLPSSSSTSSYPHSSP